MLVVTRRNGESLFISPDVEVRVLGVKGNQVRIGIAAPDGLAIYRDEVKEKFEATSSRIAVIPAPEGDAVQQEAVEV